jgi:3-methyladenine DNA glycosylase AlkD
MPRTPHNFDECIALLNANAEPEYKAKMIHFGIDANTALGMRMPIIREIAKGIVKDQALANQLWDCGIHEAKLLATLVGDKNALTSKLLDDWVLGITSWDICDQLCANLLAISPLAEQKILEWAEREEEYVRRAGFALIVYRAVHQKKAEDESFLPYFALIEKYATDPRNFVKKAVNWALRQLGKRSLNLHAPALELSQKLMTSENSTARWIGTDAYKELSQPQRIERLRDKAARR